MPTLTFDATHLNIILRSLTYCWEYAVLPLVEHAFLHTRDNRFHFVESIPCAQMSKGCLHCDTEWCVILTYSWCSSTGLMSVRTTDIRPRVTRVPGCQKLQMMA